MAFRGGLLVFRNCNHHLFPPPAQTKKAMAFPLHHRLLSTSNTPSPSLLREVREAIKQLSVSLYNCDPTSSTFNSKEPEQNSSANFDPSRMLDNKLEQLKLSVVSLRHRKAIDHRRLWEMDDSRVALCLVFRKNLQPFLCRLAEHTLRLTTDLPQTNQKLRNEFDSFITRFTRLKETTAVVLQLSETLTKSRLASLQEIIKDLSEIRKDLQQELFDELNEGLMKGKEMEEKELELFVNKINGQLVFLEERLQILLKLHSEIPIAAGSDN